MKREQRDVIDIFGDSEEIAGELQIMAQDGECSTSRYWLNEAATHILGLYADACDMQRTIKRLQAQIDGGA